MGFTLVELALSLVFISILSLTVVLLIQNVTASYRRGLILNQINTVGMDLVDDLRFSIQNATSSSVLKMCELYYGDSAHDASWKACRDDHGRSFVTVTKKANVEVKMGSRTEVVGKDMPIYGAFCTGTYTFIWNSGYLENDEVNNVERIATDSSGKVVTPVDLYTRESAEVWKKWKAGKEGGKEDERFYPAKNSSDPDIRLLKVYDTERTVCVNAMKEQDESTDKDQYVVYDSATYTDSKVPEHFVINKAMVTIDDKKDQTKRVELLNKTGESDLVLYDLYVAEPAFSETRNNFFFAVSFILGTRRGGINITEAGNSCKPPSDEFSELDYCAINKFNFAVQAGGA